MRYMRSIVFALAALSAGVLLPAPGQAQATPGQGDIVFVVPQRLLAAAPGAREAQQRLEQELDTLRVVVQRLESELDSMVTSYDQRQVMLSPEARRTLEDSIRVKQRTFQTRYLQLEQQAQARQAELLQPIMAQVRDVIEALRQERGYAMVLNADDSGIIAASPELDITQDVLQRLQSASAAGGGAAQ